ncbi:MAG TPA: threonine synthase [Blastocatellia bacterium]|nr:threonine synthase [Blastocatellia bacterium]HMX25962.1 threonine synthase [Blastocatellia bacterium]HMZ22181.1 threonine synthase [Blastocatellia bacterium]HNG31297.1 threonine synthase [Blastocatellia bacterium]
MPLLRCLNCRADFPATSRIYTCRNCSGLLDVVYEINEFSGERLMSVWDWRRASPKAVDQSGVWRFRELLPDADESEIVTLTEGNTQIWDAPRSAGYAGMNRLAFKHLGMNPTGSFKDLGMTTGITQAKRLGATSVACASTGNTSASMAAYAARAGMKSFVFIPSGQIALGKLSQALDYGSQVLQLEGDFDDAMRLVREVANETPIYLLNSVNPFRLEGQKTIAFELMQQRGWQAPDRIVVPGGNLGNSSAIGKGFHELLERGVIAKIPKITIIQAEGANPLYQMWQTQTETLTPVAGALTMATAIKIGNPVSWPKALRALRWSDGEVEQVSEQEIADAKAVIGSDGIGCEPASAVTLAGIKKLTAAGRIDPDEDIVAILTGHVLKDPDYTVNYHRGTLGYTDRSGERVELASNYANAFTQVPAERNAILKALGF